MANVSMVIDQGGMAISAHFLQNVVKTCHGGWNCRGGKYCDLLKLDDRAMAMKASLSHHIALSWNEMAGISGGTLVTQPHIQQH